ncbi:MAG: trp operon repressor [Chlamydiia bacterium]|nr:trp operon repressor [Chlamydiia bacterium]
MDKDGWRKFIRILSNIKDPKKLEELSKLLFTSEERESFAKRVRIIEELIKDEKTQREIAERYSISIAKITRGSNALKETSEEMKRDLKLIMRK